MTGDLARTCLLSVTFLSALLAAALPARADDGVITIHVVPLGPVPADLLDEMARGLRLEYGAEVVTAKRVSLPAAGPGTRHHQAKALLGLLADRLPADPGRGVRVLGVTAADIRAMDQEGERSVPGASEQHGQTAVVSTFPLRRQPRDRARLADRLSSSAVHHLGHTFGLTHCSEARCAMFDHREPSTSTAAIPPLTHHLGWACRGQLTSPVAR